MRLWILLKPSIVAIFCWHCSWGESRGQCFPLGLCCHLRGYFLTSLGRVGLLAPQQPSIGGCLRVGLLITALYIASTEIMGQCGLFTLGIGEVLSLQRLLWRYLSKEWGSSCYCPMRLYVWVPHVVSTDTAVVGPLLRSTGDQGPISLFGLSDTISRGVWGLSLQFGKGGSLDFPLGFYWCGWEQGHSFVSCGIWLE